MPSGINKNGKQNIGQFIKGYHASPQTEFKKGLIPWNKKSILKNCLICNATFYIKPFTELKGCGKYCSRKCFGISKRNHRQYNSGRTWFKKGIPNNVGKDNPNWKGGYARKDGYIMILAHNHPAANKNGYIMKHRLIMETKLKRYLNPSEGVHHINGIKDDNRPENLEITAKWHHRGKIYCPHCNKSFLVR